MARVAPGTSSQEDSHLKEGSDKAKRGGYLDILRLCGKKIGGWFGWSQKTEVPPITMKLDNKESWSIVSSVCPSRGDSPSAKEMEMASLSPASSSDRSTGDTAREKIPEAIGGSQAAKETNTTKSPAKRRRTRRHQLALFRTTPVVKSRPANTLTAQLTHVLEVLPPKVRALMKNSELCEGLRITEMRNLEENLLTRLEIVGNLKISPTADELLDKKDEVLLEIQQVVCKLQGQIVNLEKALHRDRDALRAKRTGYACCKVCERIKNEKMA